MDGLTGIEQAVLDMLLAGDHPALVPVRSQAKRSNVSRREYTGVGFWTFFDVPEDAPLAMPRNFVLSDVALTVAGLEHGAGFWLQIRNGRLEMLEGFTYDEPWPDEIGVFTLAYLKEPRDLQLLQLAPADPDPRRSHPRA